MQNNHGRDSSKKKCKFIHGELFQMKVLQIKEESSESWLERRNEMWNSIFWKLLANDIWLAYLYVVNVALALNFSLFIIHISTWQTALGASLFFMKWDKRNTMVF